MTDKTKKIVKVSGLIAVAVGTAAVCIAGGSIQSVTGIVTAVGAAVTAVSAVILAILKLHKNSLLSTVEIVGFYYSF